KNPARDAADEPVQRAPASGSSSSASAEQAPAAAPAEAAPAEGSATEGAGAWDVDANLMDAIGLGGSDDAANAAGDGAAAAGDAAQAGGAREGAAESAAGARGNANVTPEQRARRRKLLPGPKPGNKPVQRKESGEAADAAAVLSGRDPAAADAALGNLPSSGGAALDSGIASNVERATGQAVGDVHVHTGPETARGAVAISARGFATGSDI